MKYKPSRVLCTWEGVEDEKMVMMVTVKVLGS